MKIDIDNFIFVICVFAVLFVTYSYGGKTLWYFYANLQLKLNQDSNWTKSHTAQNKYSWDLTHNEFGKSC